MKKYLLASTAAGAALALSAPASAGNYVTVFGGVNFMDDGGSVRVFENSGAFGTTKAGTKPKYFAYHSHISSIFTYSIVYAINSYYYRTGLVTSGTYFSATDIAISVDSGFVIGAALGCEVGSGWALELELAYRKNNVDVAGTFYSSSSFGGSAYSRLFFRAYHHVKYAGYGPKYTSSFITGPTTFPVTKGTTFPTKGGGGFYSSTFKESGDLTSFSIMANAWFDFGVNMGGIHPYVGGGIGWAKVKLDVGSISLDDSGLAYQVGAGLGFDLPNSNSRINVEYRYFTVPDVEFVFSGVDLGQDYNSSEILVGFRINF